MNRLIIVKYYDGLNFFVTIRTTEPQYIVLKKSMVVHTDEYGNSRYPA